MRKSFKCRFKKNRRDCSTARRSLNTISLTSQRFAFRRLVRLWQTTHCYRTSRSLYWLKLYFYFLHPQAAWFLTLLFPRPHTPIYTITARGPCLATPRWDVVSDSISLSAHTSPSTACLQEISVWLLPQKAWLLKISSLPLHITRCFSNFLLGPTRYADICPSQLNFLSTQATSSVVSETLP